MPLKLRCEKQDNQRDPRCLSVAWAYYKAEADSFLATFVAVLTMGGELGIVAGVTLSIALYLWRTSKPHMAIVGRVGKS